MALHQGPLPPVAHRRAMSFADAWFDGTATLAGIHAQRYDEPNDATLPRGQLLIPMFACPLERVLAALQWDVLIDARMRKRERPEDQRGLAPLTIGLGPGFIANANVHWAVETSWGDQLGAILHKGPTLPLGGEPRAIENVGRERIVYATTGGRLETRRRIGEAVRAGEIVAGIEGHPIAAPIGGTVRGIVRGGVSVPAGTKIIEIDPRPPDAANFCGLGQRPRRIAESIAAALVVWQTATR